MRKIGIMGGTFDPIHIAHTEVAIKVAERCGLDYVLFVPSNIPPHKRDRSVTPTEMRMKMVELAIKDEPVFRLSDIEANREGKTYSIDTLKQLTKEAPNDKFYYIIGADVILDLLNWRDATEVFKICAFKGVFRPGYDASAVEEQMALLTEKYGVDIELIEVDPVDVSSSEIRDKIKCGESVDGLLDNAVERFINENSLYK